jgi:hypothetical protein
MQSGFNLSGASPACHEPPSLSLPQANIAQMSFTQMSLCTNITQPMSQDDEKMSYVQGTRVLDGREDVGVGRLVEVGHHRRHRAER